VATKSNIVNKEERVSRAVGYFRQGYNCAQAVCAAFADLYGLTEEQAMRVAASFGGGIGRMHETCGAACGMFILAGLDCGATRAEDREGKLHNYEVVRRLADEFRRRNGSLICAELLGMRPPADGIPLKKRSCADTVAEGARIFADYFEETHELPSLHKPLQDIEQA